MDMDQEEFQFLGLLGIYKQSFKLIFNCWKIFSQITLTLILPLCIIFLAYQEVSEILYWRIRFNEFRLHDTLAGTLKHRKLSDLVTSEWALYIFLKLAYLAFLFGLSLLSTAAVVYTIASVHTSREISFRKLVTTVVPRVWKRLIVTFLCIFLVITCYNLAFGGVLFLWRVTVADSDGYGAVVAFLIILGLYAIGFVYMTIIWQLASVVSVLEDSCGFRAMIKSRGLVRGKMMVTSFIFFKLNLLLLMINFGFRVLVMDRYWREIGVLKAIGFGGIFVVLLLKLFLFGLVVQTVIYFVCKSYHHESIDKSALSDHLEVYLGDYVPLKAKDVQMEDYRV